MKNIKPKDLILTITSISLFCTTALYWHTNLQLQMDVYATKTELSRYKVKDAIVARHVYEAAVEPEIVEEPKEEVVSNLHTPDPEFKQQNITQKEQILDYIHKVFGDDAPDAIKLVGECENKQWNTNAVNHNRNGTVDRGIFQLNSAYWGGEENFDWKTNIDKAYMIFENAGKTWRPWTCAHVLGQENYLGK